MCLTAHNYHFIAEYLEKKHKIVKKKEEENVHKRTACKRFFFFFPFYFTLFSEDECKSLSLERVMGGGFFPLIGCWVGVGNLQK